VFVSDKGGKVEKYTKTERKSVAAGATGGGGNIGKFCAQGGTGSRLHRRV